MGLFSPKWEKWEQKKSLEWLNKHSSDIGEVIKAALISPDPSVREAAVNLISDQKILEELALDYCEQAVEELENTDLLYRMVIDNYSIFRKAEDRLYQDAYNRLLSSSQIEEIKQKVRYGSDMRSKMAQLALKRLWVIGDIDMVRKIADSGDPEHEVYIEPLLEQSVTMWIEKSGYSPRDIIMDRGINRRIKKKALEMIDDQEFLAEYGERELQADPDNKIAWIALTKVTDINKRRDYCNRFDMHFYEIIDTKQEYEQDYEICDVTNLYRCRYCGYEKKESYRR